jgi:hypothetical protein
MKQFSYILLLFFFILFNCTLQSSGQVKYNTDLAILQDEEEEEIPENMKYYKEKYEEVYKEPFDAVWNAIKKSLADCNCMIARESYKQNEDGFYKGVLTSDMCVFVNGSDSAHAKLKEYSISMPVVYGGVWINGRATYKFILQEFDDGTVHLTLKVDICGFEEKVTYQVHFWDATLNEKSNGILETQMLEAIRKNVEKMKQ